MNHVLEHNAVSQLTAVRDSLEKDFGAEKLPEGTTVQIIANDEIEIHRNEDVNIPGNPDINSSDIPIIRGINVVFRKKEDNCPLFVLGVNFDSGVPTITHMQLCKTISKQPDEIAHPGRLIKFKTVLDEVEHPYLKFIRENSRLWSYFVIHSLVKILKDAGFERLRLASGFSNRFLEMGFPLNLALKNYDLLVLDDPSWIPYIKIGDEFSPISRSNDAALREFIDLIVKQRKVDGEKLEPQIKKDILFRRGELPVFYEKLL